MFISCHRPELQGVEVNGVVWAVSNIDARGKIARESYRIGHHHNFTDCFVTENPCPEGWQVPGYSHFMSLADADAVDCRWTQAPDDEERAGEEKCGLLFTDRKSGQVLFLPAAGMVDERGEHRDDGRSCYYWSAEPDAGELPATIPMAGGDNCGYFFHFDYEYATPNDTTGSLITQYHAATRAAKHGYSVRCVKSAKSA